MRHHSLQDEKQGESTKKSQSLLLDDDLNMPTLSESYSDAPITPPPIMMRKLPSVGAIVSDTEICTAILYAVRASGAHLPPSTKYNHAVSILWTCNGDGPFDNRFEKWAPSRANRNLKDRAVAIMETHSSYDDDVTPYPTPLQILARQLNDARQDAAEEYTQRRNTERRQQQNLQAANNHREGVLGLLPGGRGTGIPSLPDANPDELRRAQQAASLLGQRSRSQNDSGEYILLSIYL